MILSKLSLYQFSIELDRLLPVGKQRIDNRSGLVLAATADADTSERTEYVEISPLSGHDVDGNPLTGFSQHSLAQTVTELTNNLPALLQQPVDTLLDLADNTEQHAIAFGLSLMHAKLMGSLDGHSLESRTIPLIYRNQDEPLSAVAERVKALASNVHAVKVKVAQTSLEDEIQLIHQILAIRSDLKLRLDANRGFELQQAIEFIACIPLNAIEYIEEPCRQPGDNPHFYKAIEAPWALDESLNDPDYQFEMQAGLCAIIIKPMLLGSLNKLQALQHVANEHAVRTILSSSLEASLGIDALSRLASIVTPDEIPGIDTLAAFSQDLLQSSGKAKCLELSDLQLLLKL
ncbi:o-succinylbenzoate synthase [Shewanella sp. c952]|uniref:o-succinylbenzoate synthase n=1 Tax=Shewanella sp. c952 TaxID=2815913 RepID=UPI001BBBD27A|nr:o-succinylbenzoate synthase [Shewanella sp. c952]GIU11107.1 o-succinylbenzoate synthase [Shewanella sp. c952]